MSKSWFLPATWCQCNENHQCWHHNIIVCINIGIGIITNGIWNKLAVNCLFSFDTWSMLKSGMMSLLLAPWHWHHFQCWCHGVLPVAQHCCQCHDWHSWNYGIAITASMRDKELLLASASLCGLSLWYNFWHHCHSHCCLKQRRCQLITAYLIVMCDLRRLLAWYLGHCQHHGITVSVMLLALKKDDPLVASIYVFYCVCLPWSLNLVQYVHVCIYIQWLSVQIAWSCVGGNVCYSLYVWWQWYVYICWYFNVTDKYYIIVHVS